MEFSKKPWIDGLKNVIAEVFQKEIIQYIRPYQTASQELHSNFRAKNGLPICFYCKRLGHVKKYCRSRLARSEQRSGVANASFGLPRANEMTFVKEEIKEHGKAIEVDAKENIAAIGQLFIKIQMIMDEVTGMIESSVKAPVHKDTEFDRALCKGALVDVVKRVSALNKTLDTVNPAEKRSLNFTGRYQLERPEHGLSLFSELFEPRDSIT
eukprot:Seg1100.3 transcript_id=Seg1100.3/GoldUCD/mRNA.D3Y31 product="hypothetical protein" protein_id=Seg1100.3/GoldUCD/D3Y31